MTPSIRDDIATALNREDFRQWLVRIGAGEVGKAGSSAGCPTARYLNASTGHAVRVYSFRICSDDFMGAVANPEWLKLFIRGVDLYPSNIPISAVECLEILDAIPA